jgi:hypothetical protein
VKLSGYIAGQLPPTQVMADNRAIMQNPLNADHGAYLADWKSRCTGSENVPTLLEALGRGGLPRITPGLPGGIGQRAQARKELGSTRRAPVSDTADPRATRDRGAI